MTLTRMGLNESTMLVILLAVIQGIAVNSLKDEKIFRVLTDPHLPHYYSNKEHTREHANDLQECTSHCLRYDLCQAAVLNLTSSECFLHENSLINATSSSAPNGLVYIESVCSTLSVNRAAYCGAADAPTMADCQGYYELGYTTDGVYTIEIPNSGLDPFEVWCDFFDDHGWTTIQKRMDGSVDFYLYWDDYKNGFGIVDGEHWMGNDKIHALTETNQKLNIYLEAADGTYRNGYWSQFYVADESNYYRLTVSALDYAGDAEEMLTSNHNGMRFSTRDRDNDNDGSSNCASSYTGAWWYNACHSVQLNGIYSSDGVSHSGAAGVNWCCDWKDHMDSLLKTIMRVTRD